MPQSVCCSSVRNRSSTFCQPLEQLGGVPVRLGVAGVDRDRDPQDASRAGASTRPAPAARPRRLRRAIALASVVRRHAFSASVAGPTDCSSPHGVAELLEDGPRFGREARSRSAGSPLQRAMLASSTRMIGAGPPVAELGRVAQDPLGEHCGFVERPWVKRTHASRPSAQLIPPQSPSSPNAVADASSRCSASSD